MKHRTTRKVFVPRLSVPSSTITKPISSISSTITRDRSNKNIENSSNGQGFVLDLENRVTTGTNAGLTKEHKHKDITDKCIFFVQQCSVNCGDFVEFEESDGCLYENINYKYSDYVININMKNKQVKIKENLNMVILIILI